MNEHRKKQGNLTDTDPLGVVYRAGGRQGLTFFGESILCVLVHWDGSGVYVCLDEPNKAHPDPAQSCSCLGKGQCGLSVALPSTSQLILLTFWGGSCAWGCAFSL